MDKKNTTTEGVVATEASVKTKAPKKRKSVQYDNWGYFFIAPFFIIYFIFSLIPLLTTFYYSFFDYYRVGLMEIGPKFIGIKNFITMFAAEDNLGKYFWNTIVMWLMGFIPQILISLLLAVWFTNTELKLKCQQFFKTVIYMPNLIMAAAFSMLFFALMSPAGPVNAIITSMVDKMNVPNVNIMFTKFVEALTGFVAENSDNTMLVDSLNKVIVMINDTAIPKGLDLNSARALVDSTRDSAIQIFQDSYKGVDSFKWTAFINTSLPEVAKAAEPIRFFNSTAWSRGIIATMNFLMWYGNTTIMLMAGVMGIDNSLFEAARIDGANPIQIFFKVTIPMLLPIFVYVLITSLIGGIQMFDVPQILSQGNGGPNRTTMTIIMKLQRHLYSKNYGMGGSTSVLVFAITAVLSGIVYKTTMSKYTNKR